MDPFTQRMLERAKIRREKLESQKMDLENKPLSEESNNLNIKRKPLKSFSDNENVPEMNAREYITKARKSKLQKLAQFYCGNDENIFLENEEPEREECVDNPPEKKQQCKLGRLNELATKIKQWDDDMDCSKSSKENLSKEEGQARKKKDKKETGWDSALVEKLCSQGFTRSETKSKLIYEFDKNREAPKEPSNMGDGKKNNKSTPVSDKLKTRFENEGNQNEVLRKAAIFESNVKEEPNKRAKDPAELSLAERKALFEKNIGEAYLPRNRIPAIRKVWPKGTDPQMSIPIEVKENKKNETLGSNLVEMKKQEQCGEDSGAKKFVPKEDDNWILPIESVPEEKNDTVGTIPKPPPLPNEPKEDKNEDVKEGDNAEVWSPKSGRLYPSLSNMDLTHENEVTCSEVESLNESKNSNIYLNMTLSDLLEVNKNNPTTPPCDSSFSNSKECQVLNNMDRLLENALNDLSSGEEDENEEEEEEEDEMVPSPPKMMKSSSFEYKSNNENANPLIHTVSFYRKQQQSSCLSPNKTENEEEKESDSEDSEVENEAFLVEQKIELLLKEINKQQTIISQASQALNLCLSTVEFSGSGEQVEGERLLLSATHKRQACLNEIQRLKVEKSLCPQGGNKLLTEKGDVSLSNVTLKLKRDALRAIAAAENLLYFVCLIKSEEQVLASPVVSATRENLKDLALQFPGSLKLENLLSNFKITVEVYNLELNKELLPHDVKYHIVNKKEKKLLTPIKSKKTESKLIKPHVQSPAGPNAVRTSNFQMCGYIVFSLREVTRTQWTLNKVPYISPLEGTISMSIQSQLRLGDEFRGFLTMFDDISGFGAWHRRWCLLSSHFISYWKYPDDENKKVPNGTIDLRTVITENVGLVSRDVCARLNTFLVETTRPRLNEDRNSLVLNVKDNVTTIRHLLSADSKQEMMIWCKKLNTTLALLRSWKCNFNE